MIFPSCKVCFGRRGLKADKPSSVEVEVYFGGKRKWLSTGVAVFRNQWHPVRHVINHAQAPALNAQIDAAVRKVSDFILHCQLDGKEFSFSGLSEHLNRCKMDLSFFDFVRDRIAERRDIREVTRKSHRRLLSALKAYGLIQSFEDLTPSRVRDFDGWLHARGYLQSTVAAYHKYLKIYIHEAMVRDLVTKDPYLGFKIDKGKSQQRRYLTEEELHRVMALDPEDSVVRHARDVFVFQCFTGLAYADLAAFDFAKVELRDGRYVVVDVRHKSQEAFYLVLLSPALEVLKRYDFKLPIVSNQRYNAALKAVGAVIGRRITSHMGRHTFAVWCLNHGVEMETLARFLGHSNVRQTQEYAKIVSKTVERAFDKLQGVIDEG